MEKDKDNSKEQDQSNQDPSLNGMGAPTKYKTEFVELVYNYCLLGATDKRLAQFFNVCEKTIDNWKNTYPDFLQSIHNGKHIADSKVAAALYKRATGYNIVETSKETDGDEHLTKQVTKTKHIPSDPGSAFIWLKNRDPEHWRDKRTEPETQPSQNIIIKFEKGGDLPNSEKSIKDFIKDDEKPNNGGI